MDIFSKLDSAENMCKLAKEYGDGRATKNTRSYAKGHEKTMKSGLGQSVAD